MTPVQDLFVGIIAVIVGCLLMVGAIFDLAPLMSLAKAQLLAQTIGKTAARWAIAAIGLGSIAMGLIVAGGWRIRW
jgi:hypothetical protein